MLTPFLGLVCLGVVLYVAMTERAATKLSYIDLHAATVVLGGVLGSLLLAVDRQSLMRMLYSIRDLFPSATVFPREMKKTSAALEQMTEAWRTGQRATVLALADDGATPEVKLTADALLRQLHGAVLAERFAALRTRYMQQYTPVIEGWEIVSKLAPSFGMVGTVTGMVQLFRNMGENSGNLGGAMAMALMATFYGITLGAAAGGPMASRVNNQLNERLSMLDLLETTVAALVAEGRLEGMKAE